MPQQKKEHVRQAIVTAARRHFAEQGVKGSPLAAIAADAGTSIGNLYKYFSDKDALFEAAIPPTLTQELRTLLREQVEALGTARNAHALPEDHPYWLASARTRAFSIEHRYELLFLLRRAEGTPYESFHDDVAADLTRLSVRYAKQVYPELPLGAANLRALRRIYRAYVGSIADILAEEQSPRALAEATRTLSAYHLSGLRAFFTAAAAAAPAEENP
ncbi:TetR/AcrR family transcriptional regulator [Paraliomyxa miuraensis]|uniref:TetR/AcrR family transcriptional regulator n=1 Tax=Paraliomyxa miuraensis TaxID=376150 RepID=UPI0022590CB6|nr:TetR/AcrR family transcriptional regulator [Paraliomyxa miuraensis]MCX4243934.1 TetR/AcrR family transcriptional regulator [Paraliomyxa miuraensis]